MRIKKSPFLLKNFLLLKQNVEFIPPPNNEKVNVSEVFDSYSIDIDFAVQDAPSSLYQIFTKIMINVDEQKQVGYSIFSEGVGIFEFDKNEKLSQEEIENFLYLSGIPICISSLRSIISNLTCHSPFGKFTLPSVDINSLLEDKGVIPNKKT